MKKLKKIFIIMTLSFLLTAIITPEKEEKAEAIALTGIMALGALAITAVGGVFAHYNAATVHEIGGRAFQKATDAGINVQDMFAQNRFGMNQALTRKLAESIDEVNSNVRNSKVPLQTITVLPRTSGRIYLPQAFLNAITSTSTVELNIKFESTGTGGTNWFQFGIGDLQTTYFNTTLTDMGASSRTEIGPNDFRITYRNLARITELKEKGYVTFASIGNATLPVTVSLFPMHYANAMQRTQITHMDGVRNLGSPELYQQAIDDVYQNSTVSLDFARMEQIIADAQSEPVSLTNLETMVSGIEKAIEDGSAGQISILTTIWNGIRNIPNIMTETRNTVINAINAVPNALAGLWDDLGAVWTGFGETLSNVGTDIKNLAASIPTAISNGIDNIRDFNAEMLTRLSSGIDSVRDNITAINMKITEVATDLGDRIGAIGTDITTGLTSIVVPTATDMDRVRENTETMKSTFSQKFEFITVPIKSIGGLFLYPKSLYDVTFEMQGVEVHVLPESFRSSVNVVKPVLNGVIVLVTFIGIYKKIQGKEVI